MNPISKLIKSLKSQSSYNDDVYIPGTMTKFVTPNMFNMDDDAQLSEPRVSRRELSTHFEQNSIDFAIACRTYNERDVLPEEKERIDTLSMSFHTPNDVNTMTMSMLSKESGQAGNHAFENSYDVLAGSRRVTDKGKRYGSLEIRSKQEPKWNYTQQRMLAFATRLGLLVLLCLLSSFLYQIAWIISVAASHKFVNIYWFTYTWNVDMLINIVCLYLSFAFACIVNMKGAVLKYFIVISIV